MAETRKMTRTPKTSKAKPVDEYGHLQPQAPELEEAVLGALMIEKDAYSLVSEILRPESFYERRHQLIYSAITSLALRQQPVDILTVAEQLRSTGELEDAGGPFYITQLSGKVASSAHIEYHARIIAQKFLARELITFTSNIQTKAFGLAGCMAAASLTGCGSSKTESTTAANAETKVEAEGESKAEAADGSDIHVGIIFTEAGLSGNSFNDLALEGVKKAADDYGITYDEVEPKSVSDEEIIQDEMASSGEYDLIICVGAEQVDALTNVATTYPDQKFALLDANSDLDNVASYSCMKTQFSAVINGFKFHRAQTYSLV